MKKLFASICFCLYFFPAVAQPQRISFGGTRPIDTAYAGRHLRIDSTVCLVKYATADTSMVIGINESGMLVLREQGSNIDSGVFATRHYVDTAKMQLRSEIEAREPAIASGSITDYWRGNKTWHSVDSLPISRAQQLALDKKAPLNIDTTPCIPYKHPDVTGKKVVFFGNSVTKGFGITTSYAQQFVTLTGSVMVDKAVNGMSMQQVSGYPFTYLNLFDIPVWDSTIGYIVIALGENDINQANAGTFAFSLPGFRAKYNVVISDLQAKGYPKDRIVLFTPFYFLAAPVALQETYATEVRNLAKQSGVVLFDAFLKMRDYPGINGLFQGDGLHPVQRVHDSLASWLYTSDFRTETQKQCRRNWALATEGATATVTNTFGDFKPLFAINGIRRTNLYADTTNTGSAWLSDTTGMPVAFQVDFVRSKKISEVNLFTVPDGGTSFYTDPTLSTTSTSITCVDFTVDYWNGSSWQTVASVTGNNKAWRAFTFPEVTTSRMRVNVTAVGPGSKSAPIVEFETVGDDVDTLQSDIIDTVFYASQSDFIDSVNSLRQYTEYFLARKATIGGDSTAAAMRLGTNSQQPLHLETGGTDKMIINAAGRVLVGTTSDNGYKVRVAGSIYSDTLRATNFLVADFSTAADASALTYPVQSGSLKNFRFGTAGDHAITSNIGMQRFYKTYDQVEPWENTQTLVTDTLRAFDNATVTISNQRVYKVNITRETSPNEPMGEYYLIFSSVGVPSILTRRPTTNVSISVASNKMILTNTSGAGQLNYSVESGPSRSGQHAPVDAYFRLMDALGDNIAIGAPTVAAVKVNSATGATTIGVTATPISAATQLEIISQSKGVKLSKLTTAQRDAMPISLPGDEGMIIYNLDDHVYQYHNGTTWINF